MGNNLEKEDQSKLISAFRCTLNYFNDNVNFIFL